MSNQALDKRIVNIYKLKRFAEDYKVHKGKFMRLNSTKEIKETKQESEKIDQAFNETNLELISANVNVIQEEKVKSQASIGS